MQFLSSRIQTDHLPLECIYADGRWQPSQSDEAIKVICPDDQSLVATVASADQADVDLVVASARECFDTGTWPEMPAAERVEMVRKLSDALENRSEELAAFWSCQIGVPYSRSKAVTPIFAKTLESYCDLAEQFQFVEPRESQAANSGYLAYEPVGTVAAITPWNVPLSTMLNKIGPALLAGCPVIMKPAPETPLEAYVIAQCADEIGFPAGAINLVCANASGSDYLVRHSGVDKVTFTGSVSTGQRIAQACGERVARCSLELGGKSAAIVLDDYDIDTAAEALMKGICSMSGQNCAALSRVLVSHGRHEELVEKMVEVASNIRVGRVFEDGTDMGPLATSKQFETVTRYLEAGRHSEARLAFGGGRPADLGNGFFVEPTIFAGVTREMQIAREEIFGPVICVMPYQNIDEAIEIANDTAFGLSGAVFTYDDDQAYRIARRMRTGTVGQNGLKVDFSIGFGGFKKSGIGREGGIQGLRSYLEAKTILLDGPPNWI